MSTPIGHKIKEKRLVVKQGSALRLNLSFLDSDRNSMDVSTFVFSGQIRKKAKDIQTVGEFEFDQSESENGIVTLIISESTSNAMTAGETPQSEDSQYWYDVRYMNGNNEHVYILEGPLTLIRAITRS